MTFSLKNKPCEYTGISQPFKAGKHKGIDLVNHKLYSKTPIRATQDGKVVAASKGAWHWSYGNMVAIYHGGGTYTNHAHLSKICVKVGKQVKAGDIIGYMGTTGRSTGIHLHFEIHLGKKWNRVNPKSYLDNAGKNGTVNANYIVATNGSVLNVRAESNSKSKKIGVLKYGATVYISKIENGWGYIPDKNGWVYMKWLKTK